MITYLLSFFLLFSPVNAATTSISDDEKISLYIISREIEMMINTERTDLLLERISERARPELRTQLREALAGKDVEFNQNAWNYSKINDTTYRVDSQYSIRVKQGSFSWNTSGLWTYVVIEPTDQGWAIVDTDLDKILTGEAVFAFIDEIKPYFFIGLGLLAAVGALIAVVIFIAGRRKST